MKHAVRLISLAVAALAGSAASASAGIVYWASPVNTCTPDGGASVGYQSYTNAVTLAVGATGTISFTCKVDVPFVNLLNPVRLKLMYQDSSGQVTTARVAAELYRLPLGSTSIQMLTSVTSDSLAAITPTTATSVQTNHTFNFTTATYTVKVIMARSVATQRALAFNVRLEGVQ